MELSLKTLVYLPKTLVGSRIRFQPGVCFRFEDLRRVMQRSGLDANKSELPVPALGPCAGKARCLYKTWLHRAVKTSLKIKMLLEWKRLCPEGSLTWFFPRSTNRQAIQPQLSAKGARKESKPHRI